MDDVQTLVYLPTQMSRQKVLLRQENLSCLVTMRVLNGGQSLTAPMMMMMMMMIMMMMVMMMDGSRQWQRHLFCVECAIKVCKRLCLVATKSSAVSVPMFSYIVLTTNHIFALVRETSHITL